MPLVINSLRADTHKYTHIHTQTRILTFADKAILRNQACAGLWPVCAWFNKQKLCIFAVKIIILIGAEKHRNKYIAMDQNVWR